MRLMILDFVDGVDKHREPLVHNLHGRRGCSQDHRQSRWLEETPWKGAKKAAQLVPRLLHSREPENTVIARNVARYERSDVAIWEPMQAQIAAVAGAPSQ
jgi:hypothetical protein